MHPNKTDPSPKDKGMSGRQLAQWLKVSQPRIPRIEQDELTDSVTLKTMQQVAEALDCTLVYWKEPSNR